MNPLDSQMSPRLNYSIQRYGSVCVVNVIMTALDILLLRGCMETLVVVLGCYRRRSGLKTYSSSSYDVSVILGV